MGSDEKITANRINAKKSTGPRTARGKSRASGNAWRHGWAVSNRGDSSVSADVERMAKAICADNTTAALYEQAVTVAENQILILKLRAARVAAIGRARIAGPKSERPNQLPGFPTTDEWVVALTALEHGQPGPATKLFDRAARAIRTADARLAKAETEASSTGLVSSAQSSPLPMTVSDAAAKRISEDQSIPWPHDDVGALQRALPELLSLDRYERRALSRRNRAIRMFDAISIAAPFLDRKAKDT
jgi:hypothetical protein